jgi:hypothetical protein
MLGPVLLVRIVLGVATVDICPKGLNGQHVVLGSTESPLPSWGTSGITDSGGEGGAGVIDCSIEAILPENKSRKVFVGGEELVELLFPVDDIGALKPFLRQDSL